MIHSYYGNQERGHSFTLQERSHIFHALHTARNDSVYGQIGRVRTSLINEYQLVVAVNTLKLTRQRYKDNGWTLIGADAAREGRPHILSARGEKRLARDMLGNNCSQTVRTHTYASRKKRKKVKVSRQTGYRVAEKENLVIATPKVIRIRVYSDHHKRMRVYYAHWWLGLSAEEKRGVWFSDEMGVPVAIPYNVKNDIVYCEKGKQSETNVRHATKGDTHNVFSLHWCLNQDGVCYATMYEGTMSVDFFHKTLRKFMPEAVAKYHGGIHELTNFYHDHVTNSSDLYKPSIMNQSVGNDLWIQFAPKGCRQPNGRIYIEPVGRRKGYWRNQSKAADVCNCDPTNDGCHVPSASPQLNLAEYAQGYLRKLLYDYCGGRWSGSPKSKMRMMQQCINNLNENKQYFKKLYLMMDVECRDVIAKNGAHF